MILDSKFEFEDADDYFNSVLDDGEIDDPNDKDFVPSPTHSESSNDEDAIASTVAALFEPLASMKNFYEFLY